MPAIFRLLRVANSGHRPPTDDSFPFNKVTSMSFDKPLAWVLAVAICSSLVPTAGAQTYDQLEKMCFAKGSSDDQTIRGCSAIITGGRRSGTYLGAAYGGRGFAYLDRGDFNRALP